MACPENVRSLLANNRLVEIVGGIIAATEQLSLLEPVCVLITSWLPAEK
ncbi:hypothetical protein Mnod_6205 [Methylobacterium nodulans ORS 2060]|uniref:Uncharacterized protein n=1 Tax=Methylobacterium nodulans (strain LMG 21967 / CNCM I-2342 / ORS 2060) TaxID=460265 RepID=B8IVG2_METNO|nr:hypothetical protein Mnod_6205 [Methylobacterium nodulans ORS 2060]